MVVNRNDTIATSLDLSTGCNPQVLITSQAVMTMLRHARAGYPLEIGGHLIGRVLTDEKSGKTLTYIDRAMEADTRSTHTHVAFNPTNVLKVHTTCEELNMLVVGYYHSHPGFGVFQSGEDVQNFTTYYRPPHQIAVVIDPTKARQALTLSPDWLGFFGLDEHSRPFLLDALAVNLLVNPLTPDRHEDEAPLEQSPDVAGGAQETRRGEATVDTRSQLPATLDSEPGAGASIITGYYKVNVNFPRIAVRRAADTVASAVRRRVQQWR